MLAQVRREREGYRSVMPQGTACQRDHHAFLATFTTHVVSTPLDVQYKTRRRIPLKVILENRLDEKVVLWFYLDVLYTRGRANGLRLGWKANTSAPNAQVHGSSGCACSAIWLGHWGAAVDRYGPSGRNDGSISIDLKPSCIRSVQAETQRHEGSSVAAGGGGRGMMKSAQTSSFDSIGPDELETIGKAFLHELQSRALPRKSEEAEALAAKLINAYQSGVRDNLGLSIVAGLS
ncbi:hypothetical protein ACVIVC_001280 [Sinorhizobium meliloti]